jgi:hypothetical protein
MKTEGIRALWIMNRRDESKRTMTEGVIALGAVPARESAAQVGEVGYADRAFVECQRYVALLRDAIGPEPEGARLHIRPSEPDLGSYLEVVVAYEEEDNVARAYAIRCDREAPTRWE